MPSPLELRVGRYLLGPTEWDDTDARGIVWIWERPTARADYIVACDPTVGIPDWDRSLRTRDDQRTDNCAIQVIRKGSPDVQVAEYAAPISALDAAAVVNFLGRMYGGRHEEGQALVAIEVYPGPGLITQNELFQRYGYTNVFQWKYLDTYIPKATKSFGWYSNKESRRALWIRGTQHIHRRNIRLHSPWLIEEMADCRPDNFTDFTARAGHGYHDDRVVSLLIGIWVANEFGMSIEPSEADRVEEANLPDYQASAMSLDAMMEDWEDKFSRLVGESD